jgi:hypothetical protein
MALKSYVEFLLETYKWASIQQTKREFFQAIGKSILEKDEYLAFNYLLNETNEFVDFLYESAVYSEYGSLNEESYWELAKRKYNELKAKIAEKGKAALDTISQGSKALLKFGGDLLQPVKMVISKIGDMLKKLWEKAKSLAKSAVDKAKDAIAERVRKMMSSEEKSTSLRKEVKNLDAMGAAGADWVTGGFIEDLANASAKAAKTDTEELKKENRNYLVDLENAMIMEMTNMINKGESLDDLIEDFKTFTDHKISESEFLNIMEGGGGDDGKKRKINVPYLSSLMSKIGHMPPFSWFHTLGEKAEKFANNTLGKISYYLTKIAEAPGPFEFHVMGQIVGVVVGYYAETTAKGLLHDFTHWIEHALHIAIPGLGILFKIIKYTGIALAVYGLVEALIGDSKKKEEPAK